MRTLVLTVLNLVAVSALFCFFDVPYRQYRIDLLRHQLFEARDYLFSTAREGLISFNDPAYGMTRQVINGMIRFAHQVSLWQLLFMLITRRFWEVPHEQAKFSRHLLNARSALSPNGRKVVDQVLNGAHENLLSHMVHTSLCLFPLAVCWSVTTRAFGAIKIGKTDESVSKPVLDWLDCQAYGLGELHVVPDAT